MNRELVRLKASEIRYTEGVERSVLSRFASQDEIELRQSLSTSTIQRIECLIDKYKGLEFPSISQRTLNYARLRELE